jgi:hypothetical protein
VAKRKEKKGKKKKGKKKNKQINARNILPSFLLSFFPHYCTWKNLSLSLFLSFSKY